MGVWCVGVLKHGFDVCFLYVGCMHMHLNNMYSLFHTGLWCSEQLFKCIGRGWAQHISVPGVICQQHHGMLNVYLCAC